MGMKRAFTSDADFSKMAKAKTADEKIQISEVFHKAFVKVDEDGTEAAAATAVTARAGAAAPSKVFEVKADHPFLFFIRDEPTGLILFMGRVSDPKHK
jgi:serpin B